MSWTQVRSWKILERNSFQISPLTILPSYTNCYSGLWDLRVDITLDSVAMETRKHLSSLELFSSSSIESNKKMHTTKIKKNSPKK